MSDTINYTINIDNETGTSKYNPKIRNQKIKIVTMMPGYFVT